MTDASHPGLDNLNLRVGHLHPVAKTFNNITDVSYPVTNTLNRIIDILNLVLDTLHLHAHTFHAPANAL
ncbi:hypothetical protein BC826DRAFT_135763 [Russula brevipes]|nr:hypothetical protein BC826DRAFT_135763 [Russula brevipes]